MIIFFRHGCLLRGAGRVCHADQFVIDAADAAKYFLEIGGLTLRQLVCISAARLHFGSLFAIRQLGCT